MYTILHVDNSIFFKKILEEVTTQNNAKLISVTSPSEAITTLEKNDVDLIITGLEFKEMYGFDFIKFINKSVFKDIPKVVLTSNDSVKVRKKADKLDVMDVIQKDISLSSLFTFFERMKNLMAIKAELRTMSVAILEPSKDGINDLKKIFEKEQIGNIDFFDSTYSFAKNNKKYSIYIIDVSGRDRDLEKMIIDIRRENMDATIIVTSEVYNPKIVSYMLLAGADDVVIKPIDRKVLMARINASVRLQIHVKEMEKKNEELENINLELNRLVITDGLTGLYNHKYIMERLGSEVEKAKRYGRNLSVIMMDIDHFKSVNDTYGHPVGDVVLRMISDALRLNIRKVDVVGRYGVEEFFVILPETDLEQGLIIAEKVRTIIENLVFASNGLKVTISGGLSQWKYESVSELIKRADAFLYDAKHSGRNRIIYKSK